MTMDCKEIRQRIEGASSLRVHQDNLRWTIAGGYLASFGACFEYISRDTNYNLPPWLTACALFLFGNAILIILAIESWYYNLYSRYCNYLESATSSNSEIATSSNSVQGFAKFRDTEKGKITPYHHSFIFVLAIVALLNDACLIGYFCFLAGVPQLLA